MTAAQWVSGSAVGTATTRRNSTIAVALFALLAVGFVAIRPASGPDLAAISGPGTPAANERALDAYGSLPLAFVPNQGQTDPRVRFAAQAGGASFHFTDDAALVTLAKGQEAVSLRLAFLGANPAPAIEGQQLGSGRVNYLIGNDPAEWHTDLPTYGQIVYRELWPGIDMVFRGGAGQLKYEFLLRPGATSADIQLAYSGASGLSVNRAGELLVQTPLGALRDERPRSYQEIDGRQVPVPSRFALGAGSAYGFTVGDYDRSHPLVIDPGLVYSTFLGGSGNDQGFGIAVDASGAAYVTGQTASANFPTTSGAFDTSNAGSNDAFVAKLNPAGSALVYSTFLGGTATEQGLGIAVDATGAAYVTGLTGSAGFPTTTGAFDTTHSGGNDAYVAKLNATGSTLLYSTFLGGTGADEGWGIAVDATGAAYVTGLASAGFPSTALAFDSTHNGGNDAFVAKLNPSLVGPASLVYATFLGGTGVDQGYGVRVDTAGVAYVTGFTGSPAFPTTAGAFDTSHNGGFDAFVTKLNATGSAPLLYSTFLGGSGSDQGRGIALDAAGAAHVTGITADAATDYPTTVGAFDTTQNGLDDAFVTKLNAAGTALVYSTFLGGTNVDQGYGIGVDAGGASVTGLTGSNSVSFPLTTGAFDTTFNGLQDAFMIKLNSAGSAPLLYSTYLGGPSTDRGFGIAVDAAGAAYLTGLASSGFPTTSGAFDPTHNGGFDAFVAKVEVGPGPPATLTLSPKTATNVVGTQHTVTATVRDSSGNPTPNVVVRFSVSGANIASGMDTTDGNGEATFTYTGTMAGTDTIRAYADTDGDNTQDTGEPGDMATKIWTPGTPATLVLTPATATNVVGTQHCVTATVTDAFGNPVPGVTVRFSVPTSVATFATPSSGSATTNSSGQAMFCFTASLPGVDTIRAYADTDGDNTQDPGEPSGVATKTWTPPANTAFCEVTITQGGWIVANNGDRASFGGNAKVSADGSTVQGQQQYRDHGPVQPLNVHSIELTATTCSNDLKSASIFGTATIDGSGTRVFRIDVTDMGAPGRNDTYGIMLDTGYASGQKQLQGGNVSIHKN